MRGLNEAPELVGRNQGDVFSSSPADDDGFSAGRDIVAERSQIRPGARVSGLDWHDGLRWNVYRGTVREVWHAVKGGAIPNPESRIPNPEPRVPIFSVPFLNARGAPPPLADASRIRAQRRLKAVVQLVTTVIGEEAVSSSGTLSRNR